MEPSYLKLVREGRLDEKIERGLALMESCTICPRACEVNRLRGETGFCNTGRKARVASYNAHFGEEGPLVGRYGSGTIFMSSCNLLCGFCQNFEISHQRQGLDVTAEQLATMMVELCKQGCHNINFVTPTHVVPQILEALPFAIEEGLNIPLVYNSGGYDAVDTLRILEGVFDIYMPDFKFWEAEWADRYCRAPDYRKMTAGAIKEMHRQVGDLVLDENGFAARGLLVRHLVMHENTAGTEPIMRFLADEISPDTYVNVMDQYHPCGHAVKDAVINRRLRASEFREAIDAARRAGLKRLDQRDRIRIVFGL